jgi:regulation of enolase protein 1 (concanavalin A-like superfamily)
MFEEGLSWLQPPPYAVLGAEGLVVRTAGNTDFWQRTHYGFRADNGHFLHKQVTGNFRIETIVRIAPVHQYDQAGLMVRISPDCWLKTSLEHETDGPAQLGAVVTRAGYSDWSVQEADPGTRRLGLRLDFEDGDCTVFADLTASGKWTRIRMAHLDIDGGPVNAGLYACSPRAAGFEALFEYLRITSV